MRMLFSSGAGYSHIAPMLPLARAAQDAGHDVVLATGPGAAVHAESAGVAAVEIGPPPASMAPPSGMRPDAAYLALSDDERLERLMADYMVGIGAAARVDDMVTFVRAWQPDLVVSNLAERAAVMAAGIVGVPYAMHAIGPPKPARVMERAWDVAQAIVRDLGAAPLPSRDDVPYLDLWPELLAPDDETWEYPTRWPIRPEEVLPRHRDRPACLDDLPHERTAYVTAGTSHNARPGVLEAMVDGLRDQPVNVVVTVGRDGDPRRFGIPTPAIRVERWVPQDALLPHVDLVVCHAGAGTVLGALAHALPLVVAPLATDQFDIAAQVADSGAGVQVGGGAPSATAIRLAFRELDAHPRFREAARAVAREIAKMPTPRDVLERLVDQTS